MDWSINVNEARNVIGDTVPIMLELHDVETDMKNAIADARTATGHEDITAALRAAYDDYLAPVLAATTLRATNVCNATAQSVQAYSQGDLQMAADAEAVAATSDLAP